MLAVVPGTPLSRLEQRGAWCQEGEVEKLEETIELLGDLTNETVFMNEHASNSFHIVAELPRQRDEAISYVRQFIDEADEKDLAGFREMIVQAF